MFRGAILIHVPFKLLLFSLISVILLYLSLSILSGCDPIIIQQNKCTLYNDKKILNVGITCWIAVITRFWIILTFPFSCTATWAVLYCYPSRIIVPLQFACCPSDFIFCTALLGIWCWACFRMYIEREALLNGTCKIQGKIKLISNMHIRVIIISMHVSFMNVSYICA